MTLDKQFSSFSEMQLWKLHEACLLLNTPTHLAYTQKPTQWHNAGRFLHAQIFNATNDATPYFCVCCSFNNLAIYKQQTTNKLKLSDFVTAVNKYYNATKK